MEACTRGGTILYMNQPNTPTRYATCSACAQQVICTQQDSYPDNGWVLPFDTFGYYGGFDDNLNVLSGLVRSREWIMCHDCVAKFLTTFPLLAQTIGHNCHPDTDRDSPIPCCTHAWQSTDLFGQNVYGVHSRTAWPDGKWHDDPPLNPYDRVSVITEEPKETEQS